MQLVSLLFWNFILPFRVFRGQNIDDPRAAGPQIFLEKDAPRYFTAFGIHLACYTLLECTIVFLRYYLKRQNTKKDQLSGVEGTDLQDEGGLEGFEDLTDRENAKFRYIY